MTQKQIGQYIKGCIQSQGWTLTQVASKSKITRPTLDSIINGKNYRISNFIKVCEVLNVDFEKLHLNDLNENLNEKLNEDDKQD
jgi:transcriptional regulator with XRE-family HTH domain